MKVKVLKPCVDKYTGQAYGVGDILEVNDDRGAEMLSAKEYIAEVAEPKKRTAKKKA